MNAAPPGASGGQYRPLSEADVAAITGAALELLETLGMGEVPEGLARRLLAAGAREGERGRIRLPGTLVQAAIDAAPRRFTFHGRDPARAIEVGDDRVHFGTGGAAVQVLDLETRTYRSSTLQDLADLARLQDRLTNIAWFTRPCVATDMADPWELDVNTVFALLKGTTKPVATSFSEASHVAPIVEMLDIAEGGPGRFAARPYVKAHISPVISPMRFGAGQIPTVIVSSFSLT